MFCNNCGTQFPDGTAFCPNCGAPASGPAPTAPVNDAPAAAGKKPLIAIIACILAAVLLIVGLASCLSNNPKAVAKKYVKATLEGNMSKAVSCSLINKKIMEKSLKAAAKDEDMSFKEYLEERYEYLTDETDIKIKSVNDLIKAESKSQKESMKDKYGKYSVSVKVTDAEKLDKDDLKKLKDNIKDSSYGKYIEKSKIKAAYEVEMEVKIKGKEDDDEETITLYVVKYGMSWKVWD